VNGYFSTLSSVTTIIFMLHATLLAYGETTFTQHFGCQHFGKIMHCDLLLNEMEGIEARSNSTLINPLTTTELLFVNGKSGQGLQMRGEFRESIEIMNSPELNPGQFSVSFWMMPTTIEPYGHIVSHSNRPQTSGWQFDIFKTTSSPSGSEIGTLRFGVFNTNGTFISPEGVQVPPDKFTLVTGTFDGTRVRLYIDGVLSGQAEFQGEYNADPGLPLRIGSAAYCSSCNRWSGIIDELRMYERALGDDEIKQLYDVSDVSTGLVGSWKFDGDTKDYFQKHDGTTVTMLTSMVFAPDGRLFFTEKNTGAIRVMTPENEILDNPFASMKDLFASWEQGMLGLAIDPEFDINRYVYVYYTAITDAQDGDGDGKVINRVLRFTDSNNTGIDPTVIMDNIPASRGYHSGGAMAFGPDGKLYITVGDATEHIFAQDPSIVIGKVLRINKDGTIPEDNPYPNSPVYTLGHRNMYGIAFNDNGTGLVTENGDVRYDEINLIKKGGNYGFPTSQPANLPPERANDTSIKPMRSYWETIAPTQMIYYDGNALPELKGMFLFGSFTGDIYAIKLSEDGVRIVQEIKIELEHYPFVPTVGVAESPDGKIYYGGYQIYTLDSIAEAEQMLYTIDTQSPSGLEIEEIRVDEQQQRITVDASMNGTVRSDATLVARIPRALLDNVTAIEADGQQGANPSPIGFLVNEAGPAYTTISIDLGHLRSDAKDIQLTIY
jgi:glucose/arabinose dehydrogenase